MKKYRSLLSVLMALSLAMICIGLNASMIASADDPTAVIKITPKDKVSHTYEAYQIMKGDLNDNKLENITWGTGVKGDELLTALKSTTEFASCNNADDVAKVLAKESENSPLAMAFAKAAADKLDAASGTPKTVTNGAEASITVTGYGYYLIKDTAAVTGNGAKTAYILKQVDSASAEVTAKSEVPSLDKKFSDGSTVNTAAIGDTIEYKLTATIPKDIANNYTEYSIKFNDTLSKGLTFDPSSVKVYQNSTSNEINKSYYTISPTSVSDPPSGSTDITITTNDIISLLSKSASTDIIVTYSATLNKNADINGSGNANTANLEFSNDPNNNTSKGKTPDKTTTTYTTEFEIFKYYMNGGTETALPGAGFTISGEKLNKALVTGNDGTGDVTDKLESQSDDKIVYTVDSTNGKLILKGLNAGTYIISETTTPTDYNELDYDIKLDISFDEATKKFTFTTQKVKKTDHSVNIGDPETLTSDTLKVENKSGIVLPATGGIGTAVFYIVGGSITILAGVLFITKKIVDSKEKKDR